MDLPLKHKVTKQKKNNLLKMPVATSQISGTDDKRVMSFGTQYHPSESHHGKVEKKPVQGNEKKIKPSSK